MNLNQYTGTRFSRRDFLRSSAAGIAAVLMGSRMDLLAEAAKRKIPVGVQLYSVRSACSKDLPGTLAEVKKIGYTGVEFAGYYDRSAKELRQMLDDNGLKCYGTHTGLNTLQGDELKKTIEFNQVLGNKFLICPWMNGQTVDGWKKLADEFNAMSQVVRKEKMYVGYHAHAHDFHKLDGQVPWDIFFGGTDEEVVMQLDTSNCLDAGTDPLKVLKKYPKRSRSVHLKEHGGDADTVIGGGEVDWKAIFDFCDKDVTEYYIVEHERGNDPVLSVKAIKGCFEGLKKLGAVPAAE